MTISNRIASAVAAAAFSLGVALAPAAFAEDSGKTDAMSQSAKGKDTMSKSKDSMGKKFGALTNSSAIARRLARM